MTNKYTGGGSGSGGGGGGGRIHCVYFLVVVLKEERGVKR